MFSRRKNWQDFRRGNTDVCTTPISFPFLVPPQPSKGSSVTTRPASSALYGGEKTACDAWGTVNRTFYDHKIRLVRDLSCGDIRVYLEILHRGVRVRLCNGGLTKQMPRLADSIVSFNNFYIPRAPPASSIATATWGRTERCTGSIRTHRITGSKDSP